MQHTIAALQLAVWCVHALLIEFDVFIENRMHSSQLCEPHRFLSNHLFQFHFDFSADSQWIFDNIKFSLNC